MREILTNKDHFHKYGFCVVRNLLDDKEVENSKSKINEIFEENGKKVTQDLYNYRKTWEYILNDRLLNILRNLLGPNINYLHDFSVRNDDHIAFASWHRDNPCRITGKGPDWDQDEPYKVVTIITYLSPYKQTNSGITVIPSSHIKTYNHTFSNILRIFHYRMKKIKFLKGIRDLIQKRISVTIRADAGDCVILSCKLMHAALPTQSLRQAMVTRFGVVGKHSKNYINYILKHRNGSDYKIDENNKSTIDEFFNLLKSKKIYHQLPEKKEEIKGASVPLSEQDY